MEITDLSILHKWENFGSVSNTYLPHYACNAHVKCLLYLRVCSKKGNAIQF